MDSRDKKEFLKILTGLAELFDKKISDALFGIYWQALEDLSLGDFNRAANSLALTAKFFPKPAEFREQILPAMSAQAAIAYKKLEDAFSSAGVYRTVVFDDPVIHAVVENLGGWMHYCNLPEVEVKWYRKEFEKHYANFAPLIAAKRLKPPTMLFGVFAFEENTTDESKTPRLIGDHQKALAWTTQARKEKELESANSKKLEQALPQLSSLCSPDRSSEHGAGESGVPGRVLSGGEPKRAV